MFKVDIRKLTKSFKPSLVEMFEKKLGLSTSEANEYVTQLLEASINNTENELKNILKEILELSETKK